MKTYKQFIQNPPVMEDISPEDFEGIRKSLGKQQERANRPAAKASFKEIEAMMKKLKQTNRPYGSEMKEDEKEIKEQSRMMGKVNKVLDVVQVAGDVVGIADPTPTTDLVNAGISAIRGATASDPEEKKSHLINAGLRAVSAVPYAGDAVGKPALAAKMAGKAGTAAKTTASATKAIKGKEAVLRKELAATTDSAVRAQIQNKIRELQQAAREKAKQQSKERLTGSNNGQEQGIDEE